VIACTPHPGLGMVIITRPAHVQALDLSTCKRPKGLVIAVLKPKPHLVAKGFMTATVRSSGAGKTAKQTIWVTDTRTNRSHSVFSETEYYKSIGPGETPGPIVLLGWSGDAKWIFFTIDPGGSGSIMADGLTLRVVPAGGGPAHRLAPMLVYNDYMTWCGGKLVFTAGTDRVAIHAKRLDSASPPDWRVRPLVQAPGRSFGTVVCSPLGDSVVVQSQLSSTNSDFFATHWALWRIGMNGSMTRLTSPPAGYADESPKFAAGALYYVQSRHGHGELYAVDGTKTVGPLLSLGYILGYYGHRVWPYSVTR
jgi:hypothetical protein